MRPKLGRLFTRLMFLVGALLRALQLSTPLQMVIDPSMQALLLRWATTKWFWKWMGAKHANQMSVPIQLSVRDLGIGRDSESKKT
jgi:hypothetical protein